MLSLILIILFAVVLFKITIFLFRILGKVLGWILGIFGWLFLAGLAVTVFGLAAIAAPILLIAGGAALISAAAS
jgi:hypothetical protein